MNLIKSELYKLSKSKAFYLCLCASAIVAFILPLAIQQAIKDGELGVAGMMVGSVDALFYSFGMPLLTLIAAVFASIFVSSEFHHGTMKNYISKGYKREHIFMAKYLIIALAITAMALIYVPTTLLSGTIFLGFDPASTFVFSTFIGILLLAWLLHLAYGGVFTAIGMNVRCNGGAIALNITIVSILPTLLSALDYLFHFSSFKISSLWLDGNLSAIANMALTTKDVVMAFVVALAWMAFSLIGGNLLFKKRDVK